MIERRPVTTFARRFRIEWTDQQRTLPVDDGFMDADGAAESLCELPEIFGYFCWTAREKFSDGKLKANKKEIRDSWNVAKKIFRARWKQESASKITRKSVVLDQEPRFGSLNW